MRLDALLLTPRPNRKAGLMAATRFMNFPPFFRVGVEVEVDGDGDGDGDEDGDGAIGDDDVNAAV